MSQYVELNWWEKQLLKVIKDKAPKEIDRLINTAGEMLATNIQDFTPVVSGTLKRSWTTQRTGKDSVMAGTSVVYAPAVENGHVQKRRWVPGYWKNGRFNYDPESETGIMLKARFVPGSHMVSKGLAVTEDQLPKLMKNFVRRIGKELGFDVSG